MMFRVNQNHNKRSGVMQGAVTVSLALYILFSYIGITPFFSSISRVTLFIFLGMTFLNSIKELSLLKFSSHTIWYFLFFFLGLVSYFYAFDTNSVLIDLYLLLVNLILVFSFIQYLRNYSSIMSIFNFFAYSGFILAVYLYFSGQLNNPVERLGQGFERIINPNSLASLLMLSLFSIIWLIMYGNPKFRLVNIFIAIGIFYITALTGGRKFLLLPFIFLFPCT